MTAEVGAWLERPLATVLALSAGEAHAADVSVYSTTLVGGRPDVVDGQVKTVVPLYELVGLRARNIELRGFDDFGVTLDAWGGLTLPNSPQGVAAGDVNLAFVEGKAFKKSLRLRIGRQYVVGGVARAMFFDGLYAVQFALLILNDRYPSATAGHEQIVLADEIT